MAAISGNHFYDAALAYQRTAALIAALKLDIFTLIGSSTASANELASATRASPRGVRILCDFLVVTGMLEKRGMSYGLSDQSRWFLDRTSPRSISAGIDFLAAPEMIHLLLSDPESYVRNGGTEDLAILSRDNPVWVRFATAMAPFARVTAGRIADHVAELPVTPRAILDIAAGHGHYGIALASILPDAAVTAVDWEPVLTIARQNAEAAGIQDRYRTVAGSAFEVDWGGGHDLAVFAHILHHFSEDECIVLLRRVRRSLTGVGRVLLVDFVPDDDRVSPPEAAAFAFWMLATTPRGDAYTFADYRRMAQAAGFGQTTLHPLPPTPSRLIVIHPDPTPADNWR